MTATLLEERAKYTSEELQELGEKGQAFKNEDGSYSYPIADEEDLKKAIRAVGRGNADHNAIRVYIQKRAKALGASDLIPDNWNADGSLADAEEKAHVWTAEQRDTANDTFAALQGVIADAYTDSWCVWVQDWYGDGEDTPWTVVYYYAGDIWAANFIVDDAGKYQVATDVARKVRPCTSYIDRSAPPSEARALPKSIEWRQQRANALKGIERRARLERFEVRADDTGTHFTGYASLTNTPYEMGWYSETVSRGAFKKTLAENPDVTLLLNHSGLPLARTKAGTLRLSEDDIGLRVEADLDPEDPDSQTLARKMARGDLDGQMSFAFQATRQTWNEDYTQRSINEANLNRGDVSVVTQGASPTTYSSIRSDDALIALRHAGTFGIGEAFLDLRRYAGTPRERRVGMTLSSATQEVLTQILNLCAVADDAMDQAQPILAELMGVPNPDEDDAYSNADDVACGSCGAMNDPDANYCDQCGAAMPDDSGDDPDEVDGPQRSVSVTLESRRRLEALRHPQTRRSVA